MKEDKFDRFVADFFGFLALRYNVRHDFKLKVVSVNDQDWEATVPAGIRVITENNAQFQHCVLAFSKPDGEKLSEQEKRFGLASAGFTAEQVEAFSEHDVLLIINLDRPIRMPTGEPYLWNLLLSHHVLHVVELLTGQQIMHESQTEHDYASKEALANLNRFVQWVTIDGFIDRYVPTRK